MKVTDLEEFAYWEIMRPYYGYHPEREYLPEGGYDFPDWSLHEADAQLRKYPLWSKLVIGRLREMGITFPSYIKHPLVDTVRHLISEGPQALGDEAAMRRASGDG